MKRWLTCLSIATGLAACGDADGKAKLWPFEEAPPPDTAVQAPPEVQATHQPEEIALFDHSERLQRALQLRWTEQNVGCVTAWVWFAFGGGGVFEAIEETPDYGEDGEAMDVLWRADGDWSIDEYGTVTWTYETETAATTHRRTLALVQGELAAVVSWTGPTEDARWPAGAFAPHTADLREFRSVTYQGSDYASSDTYETGVTVDLTLSASPAELADGAPCEMSMVATAESGDFAAFDWSCTVSETETGLRVIHASDMPSDWYSASEQWRVELDNEGFFGRFDEYHRADQLRMATVPALVFDPADATTLVRPGGYSVLGPTTP